MPKLSAQEIERLTGGVCRVRDELYVRGRPLRTLPVSGHAA